MSLDYLAVSALVIGAAMFLLRIAVIDVLERRKLLRAFAFPRRLFFSDLLAIQVVLLNDPSLSRFDRAVLWLYFVSWALTVVLIGMVVFYMFS